MPDLEFAHTVLVIDCDPIDEAPVWDLRIRKGVRRHGTKVVVASARPTALDPIATSTLRFAPGGGEGFLVALDAALTGDTGNLGGAASASGSNATAVREFADALRAAGEEVVIVYGERALDGAAGRALLNVVVAARPRRDRQRRAARAAGLARTAAACARRASPPATAPATRRCSAPGRDAAAHRGGPRERRAAHGLAAPRRPAAQLPGPSRVGARARHRADRDRGRVAADRDGARVRRRRLPRRGLRREGGHARAPGRAPAAAAAGDRPSRAARVASRAPACARCGR